MLLDETRESAPDLIRRCQAGDRAAFEELFLAYQRRVFAIAFGSTGNYATACDVVQEVFVRLLTRIGQFRFESAFETWLYRIVLNVAHDHRPAVQTECVDEWTSIGEASQQAAVERSQEEQLVQRAIAELTPKLRDPIVLRYRSGLSYEQIATILDISIGTVASRIARGHEALARRLRGLR